MGLGSPGRAPSSFFFLRPPTPNVYKGGGVGWVPNSFLCGWVQQGRTLPLSLMNVDWPQPAQCTTALQKPPPHSQPSMLLSCPLQYSAALNSTPTITLRNLTQTCTAPPKPYHQNQPAQTQSTLQPFTGLNGSLQPCRTIHKSLPSFRPMTQCKK